MNDFGVALKAQIDAKQAKESLSDDESAVLAILNEPESRRKDGKLRRMERRVRRNAGLDHTEKIDWKNIDWKAIFTTIMTILAALLPFLKAIPESTTLEATP